jgi:hypothetical protein
VRVVEEGKAVDVDVGVDVDVETLVGRADVVIDGSPPCPHAEAVSANPRTAPTQRPLTVAPRSS